MEVIFEKSLDDVFIFKIRLKCYDEENLLKRNVRLDDFTKILQCSNKEIKKVILRNGGRISKDEKTIYFLRKKSMYKFIKDFNEHFTGIFVINKLEGKNRELIKFDVSKINKFKKRYLFASIVDILAALFIVIWLVSSFKLFN